MAFVNRINHNINFNYDLLLQILRPEMLGIQEKIQNNTKDKSNIENEIKKILKVKIRRYLQKNNPVYMSIIENIVNETYSRMYGLSLLDKYLALPNVSDVFLFGTRIMYIENGKRILAKEQFSSFEDVKIIYKKIASNAGKNISTQEPSQDAELLDGSRVLLIIEPEALEPYIAIRKHTQSNISIDNLVLNGLDANIGTKIVKEKENLSNIIDITNFKVREYLKQAVINRKNIVFVGGTGSGKTTFMNSLTHYIQKNHIVAVLEDTRELNLPLPFVYYLKTRKGNGENVKNITYEDILKDCLRANPDRIMLTEIRSGESAYALLQVLNSGHQGSMTSIHANGTMEAIDRLEELITEYKNIPKLSLRGLISKAVDIVIYLQLDEDENGDKIGRAIKEIVEIQGLNKETLDYDINYLYLNK